MRVRCGRPARRISPAIQAIYAHHVLHGLATFEEVPPDAAEMAARRAEVLARGLPYLVAEAEGRVLGYAYAAPYRRAAPTASRWRIRSISTRLRPGAASARALLAALIARAPPRARGRCWR